MSLSAVSHPPMHHPSRFTRSISDLITNIECGKCLRPSANVVAIAFARGKGGLRSSRLVVEAVCPACGYETVYFTDDDK